MSEAHQQGSILNSRQGNLWGALIGRFQALRLETQFILIASLVVFALMLLLGVWTTNSLERAALKGVGTVGARYLRTFVAPLIEQGDWRDGVIAAEATDRIRGLLGTSALGQHVHEIKIWNSDGSLFYSTGGATIEKPKVFPELAQALSGQTVVSRTSVGHKHPYDANEREAMLIEVYAPLVRDTVGKVVLVGEFYEEPDYLTSELEPAWRTTLAIVACVTVPMLGALYLLVRGGSRLIDRQHEALRASLKRAMDLSNQNKRLRLGAESARIEAGKTNEKILDQIGSELHDGPIQVLTLVQLRLSDLTEESEETIVGERERRRLMGLTAQVLDELRNISAGLVLPELEGLSLNDSIRLAITRHTDLVGTQVQTVGELKEQLFLSHLNICAYRFVQEALMNAHRHAPQNRQYLRYGMQRNRIIISVADMGSLTEPVAARDLRRIRLGKLTQKRRVQAFGGRMRTVRTKNGTIVTASLPVGPQV